MSAPLCVKFLLINIYMPKVMGILYRDKNKIDTTIIKTIIIIYYIPVLSNFCPSTIQRSYNKSYKKHYEYK